MLSPCDNDKKAKRPDNAVSLLFDAKHNSKANETPN